MKVQAAAVTYARRRCALLFLLSVFAQASSANPDIKDGAIKVLVNFKTSCNQQGLRRENTSDNGLRFTVECANRTHYPDGLIVLCPVRDVGSSCETVTAPVEFKNLNMTYGPMGERARAMDDEGSGG